MRILLTGGAGDMGLLLAQTLKNQGDSPVILDVASLPNNLNTQNEYINASILDRDALKQAMQDIDCVVHIAAWHGIHEHDNSKTASDFHDLNVTGTFNVFQAAYEENIKKIVFISSTSVDERFGLYGHTKILNEEMARAYANRHDMDILVLRPRAFIPPWNTNVYQNFTEWANWFCKGAVHINDVCQATLKSINFLKNKSPETPAQILTIDGAYDYSEDELKNWDETSSFRNHYGDTADKLTKKYNINASRKPKILGSTDAEGLIDYKAEYSLNNLLNDLRKHQGNSPPPSFSINKNVTYLT